MPYVTVADGAQIYHQEFGAGGTPVVLSRAGERTNRSQLYRELADGLFFGHNRRGDVAQGSRDAFWLQSMACGHRAAHECIAAFSATHFRPDLEKVDVPTLVIHGDDDQIVPIEVGGRRSAALIQGAVLKVYEGGAHALPDTDRDRLHLDLLEFIDA
jgi:non-heme chloroperoxidase